jgi:hypothetical protein
VWAVGVEAKRRRARQRQAVHACPQAVTVHILRLETWVAKLVRQRRTFSSKNAAAMRPVDVIVAAQETRELLASPLPGPGVFRPVPATPRGIPATAISEGFIVPWPACQSPSITSAKRLLGGEGGA